MPNWQTLYQKLLNLPLSLLVKTKSIPANPLQDLNIDLERPLLYLLPFQSNVDLLTLRSRTKKLGLPDPFTPLMINGQSFQRWVCLSQGPSVFGKRDQLPPQSLEIFTQLLEISKQDPTLDIQVVPTAILWGRKPGKENQSGPILKSLNGPQKCIAILGHGRNCLVRLSPTVSLRYMADHHGTDSAIAQKLARVAKIHFSRQKLATSGPKLPDRHALFQRLLTSKAIEKVVIEEAASRNVPVETVKKEAVQMMEEIATNFSYKLIQYGQIILGWFWNRLYQGLNIHNAKAVRQLAQDGHEIVYVPCHRSHMDYLLLSYVLYHEGMVPPHIAAGINLNFFPVGSIFRRAGAFFIRRSFKGNRLYSTVFREYLAELFTRGYSVEYFSEGGRSRTGRLLPAKTGMLSMTIQAMLRGLNRPVTLVPIYIGYEHVMEVGTYAKELQGQRKEKENIGQVLSSIRKLRNFGQGYVNFGEPIPLNTYLNEHVPNWHQDVDPIEPKKPTWLNPVVNDLAVKMMTHINDAAATNAMTLCVLALLASRQRALSREELEKQLDCYLQLLRNTPYSKHCTIPSDEPADLVTHAIKMEKFVVEKDGLGEMISLDREQSVLMTYYRNNILHLFAIPSLIARIVMQHQGIHRTEVQQQMALLFPFLKAELFLHYEETDLADVVDTKLNELIRQELIIEQKESDSSDSVLISNTKKIGVLNLLSRSINETLQRYCIALTLLNTTPDIAKGLLEKQSQVLAQRLSRLHGINAPEFFDKGVFSVLVKTLQTEGYLTEDCLTSPQKVSQLTQVLNPLLSHEVRLTIQAVIHKQDEEK